ncbi:MAG: SDR family oxidoreductase [Culturomica sp.]|jgi:NAD(P)-dependent dehydrogenase (short-subunit alcohol dehydrogenase family)|nr:SDR family oxidoreductase [Culturomica sp.]
MYNPFSLKNKTILVTGASSGIGRAIALECAKMGARLIITARNKQRLDDTFAALEGSGHQQIIADLAQKEALEGLVLQCPELDGVVHSAGIAKLILVQFIKQADIEEIFATNTFAPIVLTSLLVKKKKIRTGGSVVFISAASGVYMSSVGESLYSATKGAIHGFTKGIALDLAPKGIRVNTVNPGLVPTEILDIADDLFSREEVLERRKKQYPLKRFGKPEDIAAGTVYLLSDASTWVTGSALIIDGGLQLGAI